MRLNLRFVALWTLFLLSLMAGAALGQSTLPVTGHVADLTNNTLSGVNATYHVRFALNYCQGNTPQVIGQTTLVPTSQDFVPDPVTGLISGSLWPNDAITCQGTTGGTRYTVTRLAGNVVMGQPTCYQLLSTVGTFNLDSAMPCPFVPPVPPPGNTAAQFTSLNLTGPLTGPSGSFTGNVAAGSFSRAASAGCNFPQVMTGLDASLNPVCGTVTTLPVTGSTPQNGPLVAQAADGSIGADNGGGEKFFADFRPAGANSDASTLIPGFDTEVNTFTLGGHWNCKTCSSAGYMVRALTQPASSAAAAWTVQGQLRFGGASTSNTMGFNWGAVGAHGDGTNAILVGFSYANGLYIQNGTTITSVFSPALFGNLVWYDVTMHYYAGTLTVNLTLTGSTKSYTAQYTNFSIGGAITNFEVNSGNAVDEQQYVRFATGALYTSQIALPYADSQHNLRDQMQDAVAGNSWALIPQNYKPGEPNRWVIYDHGYAGVGCSPAGCGGPGGVSAVALSLVNAGYVVIGMQNTMQNCYGNAQCVTDHTNLIARWTALLSLAPQPYMYADSMGGFSMLSAIMHGAVVPRAIAGMCINTNLAWDYGTVGGSTVITTAFAITNFNSYATATAGYDPMLATSAALLALTQTPTKLWASYGDTVVNRAQNTDLYASRINALGGSVAVVSSSGDHEDASNFNGNAVVTFFNSH